MRLALIALVTVAAGLTALHMRIPSPENFDKINRAWARAWDQGILEILDRYLDRRRLYICRVLDRDVGSVVFL